MRTTISQLILLVLAFACMACKTNTPPAEKARPNILFAISDDQSFAHTSFAGCNFVTTPAFDRIARKEFTSAIATLVHPDVPPQGAPL